MQLIIIILFATVLAQQPTPEENPPQENAINCAPCECSKEVEQKFLKCLDDSANCDNPKTGGTTRADCLSWLWNICGTGKGDSVIVQEIVQELSKRLITDVHPAVRLEALHIITGLDKNFTDSTLKFNSLKSAIHDPDPNISGGSFNFLFDHGQADTNEFIDFLKNRAHGVVLPPVSPEPKASLNDRTKNRLQRAQTMRIGAINKLGKIGNEKAKLALQELNQELANDTDSVVRNKSSEIVKSLIK